MEGELDVIGVPEERRNVEIQGNMVRLTIISGVRTR